MSRNLPRRLAQAALLAAAGAAPIVAAAGTAHAAETPGTGLAGITRPDGPLGMPTVPDLAGTPATQTVVAPVKQVLSPSLPVSAAASDEALNAAMPEMDRAAGLSSLHHLRTNLAPTVEGLGTPLEELPQQFR